jgi:hypothetical protein
MTRAWAPCSPRSARTPAARGSRPPVGIRHEAVQTLESTARRPKHSPPGRWEEWRQDESAVDLHRGLVRQPRDGSAECRARGSDRLLAVWPVSRAARQTTTRAPLDGPPGSIRLETSPEALEGDSGPAEAPPGALLEGPSAPLASAPERRAAGSPPGAEVSLVSARPPREAASGPPSVAAALRRVARAAQTHRRSTSHR